MSISAAPAPRLPLTHAVASTDSCALGSSTVGSAALADAVVVELVPARLRAAKKAYTTRFLAQRLAGSSAGYHLQQGAPRPGDVVLARVVEIGHHKKLEGPQSRRQTLFVGDEILVAYGNRYAPDQFLAEVPTDLSPCQLVAAGGLAGRVTEAHAKIESATELQPVGLLADAAGVVNLSGLAPHSVTGTPVFAGRPPVIAVLGTSMNSGKSTTLGCLVKGLSASGLTVSAGKATGTGSGNDAHLFTDSGAQLVLDFTDFGHPTTYKLDYEKVRSLLLGMIDTLIRPHTDVVVVEIADGVYQGETARLLNDPAFHAVVDHVVFSAADALGATAGLQVLGAAGVPVAAVSGVLTASPLATREAAAVIATPVIGTWDLCRPEVALTLLPARK